jgi:3-deoxy-manno-octulosonate cytidylyltransferase (CMP-KDO synthetase)
MKKRVLLLIPARYQSTRFPGKPLALISGISMIQRVLTNMNQIEDSSISFSAYVVTDDQRIEDHVNSFQGSIVRVDDDVNSGTLRIELAYNRFFQKDNWDLIINVQGDEPLLMKDEIKKLAHFHLNSSFDIATIVKKQMKFDDIFHDANKVKAVISEVDGKALYFSRAPIPFLRDNKTSIENEFWYLHIGVYSYRPHALKKFSESSESRLENLEKLEQLRALENGLSMGAMKSDCLLLGVDTPEDVVKVEKILSEFKK